MAEKSEPDMREPAFPRSYLADGHNGMTLRDWFAGKAIAAGWQVAMEFRPSDDSMSPEQYCAGQAYAIADAMMKERSK